MRRSWNRVLEAALSGVLVGLLAAGPALAQQSAPRLLLRVIPAAAAPKLTVWVVPLDAPAQAQVPRLMYQAEQQLAGAGRFELVPLAEALDVEAARARQAKAEEAEAAFKEGQKAYDELDTQKALQQFDKAAQTYEASDLSRHFADMSRARVMKIASYVANGDNKAFVRDLKDVLARNPGAEFSPNYFPKDELAVVEKTRKAVLADANKTLQVKTGEVVGRVFVDGQFQGFSPVTLSGLTGAEHFVTISAPGYAQVQGKARGEASFTLQPVPAAQRLTVLEKRIAADPNGVDRDAALQELGTRAGTQQVVALMVRGTPGAPGTPDAIAVRVDVADGHNLAYAAGPVPLAGEAMDAAVHALLASVLQTDAPRVEGKAVHVPTIHTGSGGKTAGYVLLATGAALVAGGVYFGLQASSKSNEFKDTPQTDPRAAKLRSDGKKLALIADVGVIAGLVSAGTGSWLAFSGGGEGGGKAETQPRPAKPPPASKPAPSREVTPAPAPGGGPAPEPRPAEKPVTAPAPAPAPAPQGKPAANARAEEERRAREEAARREEEERRKREEEEKKKREEEDKRQREEAAKREQEERLKRESGGKKKRGEEERLKREEEEKQKREAEEKLKREEEEKKKRDEEARKKSAEEAKKREEEAKKKREEEEKKKKALEEDDLRNY